MKINPLKLLSLTFTLCVCFALKAQVVDNTGVIYLSPKPGSYLNHQATNIIIRFNGSISTSVNASQLITVKAAGTLINFTATYNEERNTILIFPINILPDNLKITVTLNNDLLLSNNQIVKPFSFDFYTTKNISPLFVNNDISATSNNIVSTNNNTKTSTRETSALKSITDDIAGQTPIQVLTSNQPNEAYYFISTITYNNSPNRCMILDNKGRVVYERFTNGYNLDFKMLSDTLISYYDWNSNCYYILNTAFTIVDSVKAQNGYVTDNHELQIDKKTGHYFLLAQEHVTMNMQDSVAGGYPNANVLGLIVQELDANKNVVFEWHTLDYLPVTASVGVNLAAANIDYIHCNSIDLDTDTTFLLSSRHLNEVERIDRRTGKLIWRFGKAKNGSQFTFLNDTKGFSYQHDARRLQNGNILLFDNGNYRTGNRYSRAVEYKLNEENHTATMVWDYRNTPDVVSDFMGSAQRMHNGNTLIGWGGAIPTFTEVDSNNNKLLEVAMTNPFSYRAYKYDNLSDIIKSNQNLIASIPDTIITCNSTPLNIISNLNSVLASYIPTTFSQNLYTISSSTINNGLLTTESNTNFYKYYPICLNNKYSFLIQKDTFVCLDQNSISLAMHDECKNLNFKWSTAETTSSIKVNPPVGTSVYWVEMTNGTYYKRDSVKITVSGVPNFEILGQNILTSPFETKTYSVPFDPTYSYSWNVKNGNIINGYNTNAVTIQWGNKDSNILKSVIINQSGCSNTFSDTIFYKKSTGVNELSASGKLSVYPNPVKDLLVIDSKEEVTYQLFDVEGKMILSNDKLQKNSVINMADFASGYYLLNIYSSDKTERIKVIKN